MAERSAWGIDIGNRALKAIKLVRDGNGLRVDDYEVIEHETVLSSAGDNRESLIQSALANFIQRHPTKGGAVAVGVSGQASFARFIKLPPVERKKIPEIVRFEAIQQIPFPLDDVEWSFQLFEAPESPDIEVGIFAMRKELINQHIGYFTSADLNVQVVQMNPLAVYNAVYYDNRIKETTMIIDLGAENTDLVIADENTIWLRSIPIGGNNFTEALVKAFKLNFAKAEDLKRNAATSKYARQIFQAMRPVFADLVAEVQRSIGFYASVHRDSRISKILAIGGTFKLPGLQKYLQQNLQLDVERLDNLGTGAPADPKLAAGYNDNVLSLVSAYGLAIQAMGEGKITSSLLPQSIRRARLWQQKTKWFAAAAAIIAVASGVGYLRWFTDNAAFASQESTRGEIKGVVDRASDLDNRWGTIAQAGSADRLLITNIRSLENYRALWPAILTDIHKSLPPSPTGDVAQIKLTPRNQRRQIWIDTILTQYKPELSGILADPDWEKKYSGDSNRQFDTLPAAVSMAGPAAGGYGGDAMGAMGGPAGDAPVAAVEGAVAGEAHRGFLITLTGTTPNANATDLIDTTIVKTLRDSGLVIAPGQKYSFAKVQLVSASQLKSNPLRITALQQAFTAAMQAKKGGQVAPASGGAFNIGPGAGAGPALTDGVGPVGGEGADYGAGGAGIVQPPDVAGGGAAVVDESLPFKDRQTGEDVRDDWEFKVLIAVVLDPTPKAAAPAEGAAPATPPAEGAAPAEGATPATPPTEGAAPATPPAEGAAPATPPPAPATPAAPAAPAAPANQEIVPAP